jgi:hypothetical protein
VDSGNRLPRKDIGTASIAYRVFGEGRIDTVVEGYSGRSYILYRR